MLPDAQTLSAQGQPVQLHLRSWLVLLGPAHMRPEVSERLRKAVADIVADPEVVSALRQNSLLPFPSRSTAEVKDFIEREWQIFKDIQRETGVKVE
jgi:tripartite-type tricarboxylate transporter receptor subunit TctC